MPTDKVEISLGLLLKLGSAIVHAEEYLETGEAIDRAAFQAICANPDVVKWREEMDAQGLLVLKR